MLVEGTHTHTCMYPPPHTESPDTHTHTHTDASCASQGDAFAMLSPRTVALNWLKEVYLCVYVRGVRVCICDMWWVVCDVSRELVVLGNLSFCFFGTSTTKHLMCVVCVYSSSVERDLVSVSKET